jgi:hypothetical protein
MNSHSKRGINKSKSEEIIRIIFFEYSLKLLKTCLSDETFLKKDLFKEYYFSNTNRINIIKSSITFKYFEIERNKINSKIKYLESNLMKLNENLYLLEHDVLILLNDMTYFLESNFLFNILIFYIIYLNDGVNNIAFFLNFNSKNIQLKTCSFLNKIEKFNNNGKLLISNMNFFFTLIYLKLSNELNNF